MHGLVRASLLRDRDGRVLGGLAQVVDLTARRRTEEVLRQSEILFRSAFDARAEQVLWEGEERFRVAFEDAPIGMALVAPGGRVLRINRAFAILLGRGAAAPPRFDLLEAAHPDDRDDLLHAVRQACEPGRARVYGLWRFVGADGEALPRHLVLSAVRDAKRAVTYLIAQLQDLPQIP